MYYASICAIIKDEDKDVREWLNYHFMIGFEHCLIFDNNSRRPLKETLSDFVSNGLVTVEDFPLTHAQQLSAYMSALKYWGNNTRWLAFIDVDEFILPMQNDDIRDFLDDYTQYGGVGANWAMFSSNGHVKRPAGGILENYTACLGLNSHIKSIVQPAKTQIAKSAHHFLYTSSNFCANEDGIPIPGFSTYPLANKIRINHYYYKSRNDFMEKIDRGLVTQMKSGRERTIKDFDAHLDKPTYEDRSILRFKFSEPGLSHISSNEILGSINNSTNFDLEKEIMLFEKSLDINDIDNALHRAKKIARYYNDFNIDQFSLQTKSNQFDNSKAMEIIKNTLSQRDLSNKDILSAYQALASYYEINGEKSKSISILNWLEDPMSTYFGS